MQIGSISRIRCTARLAQRIFMWFIQQKDTEKANEVIMRTTNDNTIRALRSIELTVPDLDAASTFYRDVWGLDLVDSGKDAHYLRGTGAEHHIVVLRRGASAALRRINFAANSKSAVDTLYQRLGQGGVMLLGNPAPLDEPGGGYGFALVEPDGRELRVLSDLIPHRNCADAPDRPRKLSHIVLNTSDADAATTFFTGSLGFRISDQTRMMDFLRCNSDHHSLALARMGGPSLNHIAFEVPSFDALMRGCGRLKENGCKVEWGIGRHGPGNNVFAYFVDPHGFAIEYTAEFQQVDDATHKPGLPQDWVRPANRVDQWGFADPPSDRMRNAMHGQLSTHR